MSHRLVIDAASAEADGSPVIDDYECLRNACRTLTLIGPEAELEFKTDVSVGIESTQQEVKTQGYEVRLRGWHKPAYFDTENRTRFFDNWPVYYPTHPEVVAGSRRTGEQGRWGDFNELLKLESEYVAQVARKAFRCLEEAAALNGDMLTVVSDTEDELVLEVETL